ncbi:MAG: carbon-nitrogen hydrolase family protein [Planctomycetes bacterium]|nr:carbon-nitrogen hydrolase family protein [Planctomycetota bacterium]
MQKKHPLVAAAIQLSSNNDRQQNVAKALELIDVASARGARLVALPEMFNYYSTLKEMVKNAEPIPGPTIDALAQKARANGLYILCGSIIESAPDGKGFNTSVMVGPDGNILGVYRKINLFDVEIPGKVRYGESEYILPGNEMVTLDVDGWVVGLAICYDLRFPEIFNKLASQGAEIVVMPTACTAYTGKDHWEVLLRARAIENQFFVVAPNRYGTSSDSFTTHGRSMIVDPWGIILSQAPDKVSVISAELDIGVLQDVRRNMPMKRQNTYEVKKEGRGAR